ncbi:MAG TPA: hypothetical protein DFS52_10735 [Myxococcales bacterium]|jgi:hypothetical protein|nr:hypothetical protein [Myxococcales bacterium]
MKSLKWIAACLTLLAPASSFAVGISLSAGGGYLHPKAPELKDSLKGALELTPFHEILDIVRLEVPVEMQLKPVANIFAVRPGVKVFFPVVGLYARAGYGLGNINGAGDLTHTGIVGIGWQLALLDTVGIFFEGTGEPALTYDKTALDGRPMAFMLRVGALLDLD